MSITNLDNLNLDTTLPTDETSTQPEQPLAQKEYTVSQEEIELLQKQVSITEEQAKTLLLKNKGNFVNAIIDFYDVNYKKGDSVGIAQPTITAFTLENEPETNCQGKMMTLETIKTSPLHKLSKTYLFVNTNPNYDGFTKKKKYCTLAELIESISQPDLSKELSHQPGVLNVYELVGRSNDILEKWSMPSSAIVLCPEQIISNTDIVERQLLDKLNKNATQIARHSNIIKDTESVVYSAMIVGNVDFN
jgi:hypothetical protein